MRLALALLILTSCGAGEERTPGSDGRSCTTIEDGPVIRITCNDGSSSESPDLTGSPGPDGASGHPGPAGRQALVVLAVLAPDELCTLPRVLVTAGHDLDGDGILDAAELEASTLVCGDEPTCESLSGDVRLGDELALRAFQLAGCSRVDGDLGLGGRAGAPLEADLTALRRLASVHQELEIAWVEGSLEGLEGLRSVGRDLWVHDVGVQTLAGLEGLRTVGGDVILGCGTDLQEVSALAGLEEVRGDLRVADASWGAILGPVIGLEGQVIVEACP